MIISVLDTLCIQHLNKWNIVVGYIYPFESLFQSQHLLTIFIQIKQMPRWKVV